jgi:replication factor C subunit 3/5
MENNIYEPNIDLLKTMTSTHLKSNPIQEVCPGSNVQQSIYNVEKQTKTIPWVEKYRPDNFQDIVLDPYNRQIFNNIIKYNYFPNLLFYGPPGTGKTTTIINLIKEYQIKHNRNNKGTIIHLNASDERGIDIIRNQIHQFVRSKNLFDNGLKFVILDEVDYMTKNAQQALKYLLQTSVFNVRFFLICNYISKIETSLQNEFICVRFNQLPKKEIFQFIKNIAEQENIQIPDDAIEAIQSNYNSDIRSIINCIQLHQNTKIEDWKDKIIHAKIFDKIYGMIICKETKKREIIQYIYQTSIQYNMNINHILQDYFHHIISKYPSIISSHFLHIVEMCIHNNNAKIDTLLNYFVSNMKSIHRDILFSNL